MKKTLSFITAIFLLAGCNQTNNNVPVDEPVSDGAGMSIYKDEEFNISFNYPSDWTIDEQDRFEHAVGIFTGDNEESIFFDYQINPEEFENSFKKGMEENKVSVEESSLAGYPAKEYRMEGAIKYLVEIENEFVLFDSEFEFTQEQKEGMKEILNSLSF